VAESTGTPVNRYTMTRGDVAVDLIDLGACVVEVSLRFDVA
jgi:hypothetical protein